MQEGALCSVGAIHTAAPQGPTSPSPAATRRTLTRKQNLGKRSVYIPIMSWVYRFWFRDNVLREEGQEGEQPLLTVQG